MKLGPREVLHPYASEATIRCSLEGLPGSCAHVLMGKKVEDRSWTQCK